MTTGFPKPVEPLLKSQFFMRLELKIKPDGGVADATFSECQGFQRTQDCISVAEVTPMQWGKASRGRVAITKVPGNAKSDNLVLRRGLTHSKFLWNWFEAIEVGKWYEQAAKGSLTIYGQEGVEHARYEFQRAWPMRYQIGDLNAQSSELEIEELELAIESLTRAF